MAAVPVSVIDFDNPVASPRMRNMIDGPATLTLPDPGVLASDGRRFCCHQSDHGGQHFVVNAVYVAW